MLDTLPSEKLKEKETVVKNRVPAEKTPLRGKLIYTLAYGLLKRLLKKPEISGKEKIENDTYAFLLPTI